MSDSTAELEQRLAALQIAFAAKLDDRLGEIEAAVRPLAAAGGDTNQALRRLRDLAHKLSGSGATFGFADLGREAAGLESLCVSVLGQGDGPSPGDKEEIEGIVERLKSATDRP